MSNTNNKTWTNPQKRAVGLRRWWGALGFSAAGLRAGWAETAFRQEAICACFMVPGAFWLGSNWTEVALLAGSIVFLMVVELLNTALEAVVDRVGPEWHALSKRAKDMASAAVLLSLLLCAGIWIAALYQRFH
jgi:diacylglycerol kinase (ATP)